MTEQHNNNNNRYSGAGRVKNSNNKKLSKYEKAASKALKKAKQLIRQSQRDQKYNKTHVLESHGLLEAIGGAAQKACDAPGYLDQAMKLADALEQLKETLRYKGSSGNDLIENVICRFEDLISLIICIANTKNYAGFMATVHLYIRTHYSKSTSKFLLEQVTKMFSSTKDAVKEKLHSHSSENDMSGLEAPPLYEDLSPEERVSAFRRCLSDWKTMRHGAFARHACQFVNILTTFGWLDLEDKPISIGSFELFRARVWDVQKDSLDFMDVIFDTFGFFLERGYLAFAKGDLSLLMYSDAESAAFEQEYSLLVACDSLMETGRLDDLKTETIKGESDFESRLELLISKCYTAIQTERNPQAKNVYTNRLVVLKKLRSKLIMLQKQSPVRTKPYGVAIFGGSAVGKTIINSIITKVLLTANGFESSKQHVVTLNDSDPYQSEFRTFHNAVTMDDFGNTKADKYETSPTAKIIDFLNNVPKAALSPIAELKGNVMIRPKLVSVTTNVKRLLSNLFSNEPVSILRRFEVHLDVRLRDEWVDPETGGINASLIGNTFIPDAWVIDLQRVKIIRTENPEQADDYEFETILKDASINQVLEWMREDSAKFYSRQADFVSNVEKFYELELCPHYNHPHQCKSCEKLDEHGVEENLFVEEQKIQPLDIEDPFEHIPMVSQVAEWYRRTGVDCAVHSVQTTCKTLADAFESHKGQILATVFGSCAAIGLVYTAINLFRSFRKVSAVIHGTHGREDGIPEVLPEDHESNWKKVEQTPIPMSHSAMTRPASQFEELISRHLAYCTVFDYTAGKSRSCNIWPISGNTWLLPSHMIHPGSTVTVKVLQGRDDSICRRFSEQVDDSKIQRFGDDYMLVRLVQGGPVRNTLDMLVEDEYPFAPEGLRFMVKNEEGVVHKCVTRSIESDIFATTSGDLKGFSYRLTMPTAEGMCIAPVFTYRTPHVIVGFHLAGRTGSTYGVAGFINATMVKNALQQLDEKNDLVCHSEGTFKTEKYGRAFPLSSNIPKDHAVHRLGNDDDGDGPNAQIYGSHDLGRSFFRTQVRQSPISRAVKDVMNIDREHGPPNRENIGKHWERDLNLMSHPKGSFDPQIWKQARNDLEAKVEKVLDSKPEACRVTHPLAQDYVLSGADGIAAYSRIPLNTSTGWPLNKKKANYMSVSDKDVPGVTEAIEFDDPMFQEEIDRIKDVLRSGERVHTVFRGNLKDEPTKWTKDKIRVFAGSEVAFTCVVREYYLPIIRLIQNNWIDFECAVGINAHGKQWDELTRHISKFGKKRFIAGDYSAFDKSASPEAMLSAFNVLISIAKKCGYTEEEITIMRGIATEISYPIYELDGVILQLFGSNPSGHPLTVIINNLMNQLYMRYAYYYLHQGEDVPPFDEVIALICYGDDNIMGVSDEETAFVMKNIVEVLNSVGIKYTKADKTAITENDLFEELDNLEFLKRAFVYNPAFGAYTAALSTTSIGKSLHNQMVSSTPREEIAAQAIRSANVEFAYHGAEEFHRRQPQLYEVAARSGITGLVGELPSLSEIVDRFHERLPPKSMADEPLLDSHSMECDLPTEIPTKAEFETYIEKAAYYERLKQFGRLDTKRGKQTLRYLEKFHKTFGKFDIIDEVSQALEVRDVVQPPYLNEECQLRELRTRMENYGFETLGLNVPLLGDKTLGEVDGLFQIRQGDHRIIVLVEAKMNGNRQKGLSQLGKMGLMLAVGGPSNIHLRTVLMTGRVLEVIGEFGTSNFEWPEELQL